MRFRIWLISVGSLMVLASVAVIACVWKWDYRFGLPASADKITRINTIVATSAYAAAIIAAIFALIAYWQASGLPSLEPDIRFPPFHFHSPVFPARLQQPPPWVDASSVRFPASRPDNSVLMIGRVGGSELILTVELKNTTKYAARNPGLRIQFDGLLFNGALRDGPLRNDGEKGMA